MKASIWYIPDSKKISNQSFLEHLLNFGRWSDIQDFIKTHGKKETVRLFNEISQTQRTNLKPNIKDFFTRYFHYVS